jgi:hypothetical protein
MPATVLAGEQLGPIVLDEQSQLAAQGHWSLQVGEDGLQAGS